MTLPWVTFIPKDRVPMIPGTPTITFAFLPSGKRKEGREEYASPLSGYFLEDSNDTFSFTAL